MEKERDDRKPLMHSEIHFRGYWVQLQSRIRKNDDADDYLEGYLTNPLITLRKAWNAHHENPRPAGDNVNQLYNTGDSVSEHYNFATCIATLYKDTALGDPPGSFPPTLAQLAEDPMKHFKFFFQATDNGTKGGTNAQDRSDAATKAWVKTAIEDMKRCRKACKHIWDTALATFTSAKATTMIAGLPYGSGPALLRQIESQQERQTTMALFTLFDQLISLKLGTKENFAGLYARALGIRARLKNWNPPIDLPDQLMIVCLMRQLPRQFHGTRTIIMTSPSITLPSCRDMLLDAENRDAERVKRELGTAGTAGDERPREGTGLIGDGDRQPRKPKKRKKRKPAEKSAKYHSEGPCSVHGSRCSHASSECYVLHPELKPNKKSEASVAEAEADVAETSGDSQPYGFMNEELGYCLMMYHEDTDEKTDEPVGSANGSEERADESDGGLDASTAFATPVLTSKSKKVYAVAVGHQTGIFLSYDAACRAYKGYPGAKFKGFKDMAKAQQYLKDNQPPTATYSKKPVVTRRKPKSYGWSQKGTKATRRAAKNAKAKNVIEAEVLQFKRSKSDNDAAIAKGIKRMARTGGIKDLSEPEVIDLSGSTMDQESEPSVFKDMTDAVESPSSTFKDSEVECLKAKAVRSLANALGAQRGGDLGVKLRRSFAPGLTTTLVHPSRIPREAVSESGTADESVTFELQMDATTLQRLQPGAKVKLEVSSIKSVTGVSLIGEEAHCKFDEKDVYAFMNEQYDADSEDSDYEESDAELCIAEEAVGCLSSDDDDSSDGPPGLITLTKNDVTTEDDSDFCSESSDSSEGPPGLISLPYGCTSTEEETDEHVANESSEEEPPELIPYSARNAVYETDDGLIDDLSDDEPEATPSSNCLSDKDVPIDHDGLSRIEDTSSESEASLVDISDESSDTFESDGFSSDDERGPEVDVVAVDSNKDGDDEHEAIKMGTALVNSKRRGADSTALDSGATEHCAKHIAGTLDTASVGSMSGLNGSRTPVKGMARVNKMRNVMCMPGISRNLLSVGRLLDEYGGQVAFTKHKAHLVTKGKHEVVAERNGSGLYIVCNKDYELGATSGTALAGTSVSLEVAKQRVIALHKAYGHASIGTLNTIIANRNFDGVTTSHLKLLPPCEACLLGKAHKAPKQRRATEKATVFAERLCADCTGPFRTRSVGGSTYLLVVLCEFSAWTWVFPVSTLQMVVQHLRTLLEVNLHQRDDRTVKFFRSDGGTEFNNKKVDELLGKHDIVRETTCANTSFQNGKAERRIRTLFDRVRTVLSDASSYVGRNFWADAAVYAAYTLNRTPSEDKKSPFELRYGRKPKVSHLRPFGNPCVVYRKRTVAGKIQDAGVKGTFLGYGYVTGKKGYRVRLDGTNSVVTSRDVSFCGFESRAEPVQLLPEDATTETIITEPANAGEVEARLNLPVRSEGTSENSGNGAATSVPVITEPANAREVEKAVQAHTYRIGAKVEADWRGHGSYYPAVITGVHEAGANGSRNTYDLVYECDGEVEQSVSSQTIRPRTGKANVAAKPCGHALMTDCNPAYLSDVPDLARAHVTPKHYGEACRSNERSQWTESMKEELESLRKQGVYAFVDELPTGEIALRCLWVYKVKCGASGEVTRYKSRLTVNGKSQRYGIDYQKTFSPVAFATSIRLLFALGIANNFKFRQYDIKCAFLYADLPKEQQRYMHAPPGSGRKGYWLLKKSLYGLRQAPMLFNGHLDKTLRSMGFTSCSFDPCLYLHKASGAYLVVVVDDMVLASPSVEFSTQFYKDLSSKYDVKDLGEPSYVIGVRVNISPHSVEFTQDRYISDLFALHQPGDKPTSTPATPNQVLCASGIHKDDDSPLLSDPSQYRSLVGGLMYTLITRPDVATATSICARYVQSPREAHLEAAKRILRFLHHTRERPLVYTSTKDKTVVVKAFVDSSWGNDIDTRRSRFGYAIFVGKSLVAWCSKLHPALAMSSAEAEYTAATEATKAIKWIVSLISFLGIKPQTPVDVYEDNAACRIMASSSQVSGRNKHFELRQHFVRTQVAAGLIKLLPVNTKNQIADIFTKPTVRPIFEKHATALLQGLPDNFLTGPTVEGGC